MAIRWDIQGSGGGDDQDGLKITRIVEVVPDGASTDSNVGIRALQELSNNNAALGDVHPDWPQIRVSSRPYTVVGGVVTVRLNYSAITVQSPFNTPEIPPDNNQPAVKTLGFASRRVKTTQHYDDFNVLQENTVTAPAPKYSGAAAQLKTIERFDSMMVIKFSREEVDNPTARVRSIKDAVNELSLGGVYTAGTVLARPATVESKNSGESYSVTYEFWWHEDGHGTELTWTLANEKQPDVHDAGSRRNVVPYKRVDFTGLNLDWSD